MTLTDWFGVLFTIVIFLLMLAAYWYVFKPSNKDNLESHRSMAMDDDEINAENDHGR